MNRALILMAGIWASCSLFRDPRANCNHPEHEKYIREKQTATIVKTTRARGGRKVQEKRPKPVKSCPRS